jgi:hydroxypyruvate isomerase
MKRIKFSAADWCFVGKSGLDPATYYGELRRIGYEAVEMTWAGHRAAAHAAGLEVINLCGPGMQKGLNRLENHAELLPQIRQSIAEAGQDRIPYVILFSGNRAGQSDSEGIKNCIVGIEQVVGDASQAGVTLLFEMLNSFEHPDYQADSSKYGLEIVKRINSPALKVVYDIYHMERMGEDSVKDVTGNLSLCPHLHVAESPARTRPLADGKISYREIVGKIVRAGYAGYWGMEFLPGPDVIGDLRAALTEFTSFVHFPDI